MRQKSLLETLLENERGGAMVISLLTLIMLTMVGTLFMIQTNTETQIAGHDMRATQALYNAEAGTNEVLARMSDASDTDNYIGPPANDWFTNPGWGRYLVLGKGNSKHDPNVQATMKDGLDNDGDGHVDETNEVYPEVATKQTGGDPVNYPWVNVRYRLNNTNQVVLFGDHDNDMTTPPQMNLANGFPVIVVTASGGQGSALSLIHI